MTFKKGEPRPPNAGRKVGSVNRVSVNVRKYFENNNIDLVAECWKAILKMPEEKQPALILQLMPYVYPRLAQVTLQKTPEEEAVEKMSDAEVFEKAKQILLEQTPVIDVTPKIPDSD